MRRDVSSLGQRRIPLARVVLTLHRAATERASADAIMPKAACQAWHRARNKQQYAARLGRGPSPLVDRHTRNNLVHGWIMCPGT